ncbi:TetR/AcrR family transcriptional regulator [Amycolatopsis sp. PS_44_ISF1]|uniref:TetR/AcrR family transcriptional regulator n=1 Tax=Amycolatopsis sp. PS_44_ISF1 TaxID=2974917 RepID=UPI0028DF0440|nr:TetR/AcrR family transcriptional regulator [Amycolatopsis sp. PS_44_ISF1]MDT8911996.1 TetR/AcrR family transcriptional regulator [Amycolatopsis sp. PS_44_ISF1]
MAGRYHSPRREAAAQATRAAILQHARTLFLAQGYCATTVSDIAHAAQVATPTVYSSTGGKAAMFAELLQPAIRDPLAAQEASAALQAGDPREVMTHCAAAARHGQERNWDLVTTLLRQPPQDEPARQAVADIADGCLTALTRIARHLTRLDALAPGIDTAHATDTLWYYFGHNSWHSLIIERGWSFDQAEPWLLDAATHALLAQP